MNLKPLLTLISQEKDLEPSQIKEAIEEAILAAAQRNFSPYNNARPVLDLETGDLAIFVTKTVVDTVTNERREILLRKARKLKPGVQLGDDLEVQIDLAEFGRIAAQTVKHGIFQRLREAERDKAYEEIKDKVGQLVSGTIERFEKKAILIALGRVEAVLPRSEVPANARYRQGDRIKAYITEIRKTPRGPFVRLSRTHPQLIARLFEAEVPEVAEGVVKIMAIAREPGVRTKVAVSSESSDVDPVGACVGMKGTRVQLIVSELENEKIDVIPWSADPKQFIVNALSPAKVLRVELNEEDKEAEVTVSKDSLSVAIGKRGQNAKLASRLTGWHIDIRQERREVLTPEDVDLSYLEDFLNQIAELDSEMRQAIKGSEYNTVTLIAAAEPEMLQEVLDGDLELAQELVKAAGEYQQALESMLRSENQESPSSS